MRKKCRAERERIADLRNYRRLLAVKESLGLPHDSLFTFKMQDTKHAVWIGARERRLAEYAALAEQEMEIGGER
jgi:hypothetical protein